jgi:hypothetical protein
MKYSSIRKTITKDDVGKTALFPYGRLDFDEFEKIKSNRVCISETKNSRNPKLFKKYWSLCRLIADGLPTFQDQESVSDYMKMKTGLVDFKTIVDGVVKIKVKSIAWENMSPDRFEEYWEKFIPIACELLGCTEQEINDNIIFYQ